MRPTTITSPSAPDLDKVRSWIDEMIAGLRFIELVASVIALITRMRDLNTELVARLAYLKRKRPPSETLERLERQLVLPLFVRSVATPTPAGSQDDPRKKNERRRGRSGGRGDFPAHLERVPVPNNVPADMRTCPTCGTEMKTVDVSCCEMLDIIPARIVVSQRLDETVACPCDDTIVSAPVPPQIVERGKLADRLLIEALCDKYLEHQPIERQCARFARAGVEVAPQTLGRGVNAAIDLLAPLADLIVDKTREPGLLGTDATSIPILDPNASEGIRAGTVWCWTNARWVSFFYSDACDSGSVRRLLGKDLARDIQCDGTNLLSFIEKHGGKRPGCWSHARRGFVQCARTGDVLALEAVRLIAPIFEVECVSKLAGDTADERRARRDSDTRPVIAELRAWLDDKRAVTPPKTPLGRALGYLHRQWRRLILFLDDGNIEATNNRRERELRRLVLGRKNWLFTWLDDGGKRTARILTIVATCIAHDVNPRAYLHLVANLIVGGWPNRRLRELLPDRILERHPELDAAREPAELALGS